MTTSILRKLEDRCPYIITKSVGDESSDFCERTERPSGRIKPCLKESGLECDVYNEWLKERDE